MHGKRKKDRHDDATMQEFFFILHFSVAFFWAQEERISGIDGPGDTNENGRRTWRRQNMVYPCLSIIICFVVDRCHMREHLDSDPYSALGSLGVLRPWLHEKVSAVHCWIFTWDPIHEHMYSLEVSSSLLSPPSHQKTC